MPAEPALLHEAACWVDTWQEPCGHTNYEAALQLAERYLEADCCYIFSDGLSDYAVVLLEVHPSPCRLYTPLCYCLMLYMEVCLIRSRSNLHLHTNSHLWTPGWL